MKRIVRSIALVSILIVSFPISSLSQPELTLVDEWQVSKKLSTALFSPDGKNIATADSVVVVSLDPENTNTKAILQITLETPVLSKIHSIAYSPDGKYLAGGAIDGSIFIWDASKFDFFKPVSANSIQKLSGHSSSAYNLQFSPDSKYLASGGGDSTIIIWEAASWKNIKKISVHSGGITDLAFSPGGTYLVSSSVHENFIRIWDVATWSEYSRLINEDITGIFAELAYSPDGRYLASTNYSSLTERIIIWDMWNTKIVANVNAYVTHLHDIIFSPDGKYLYGGGMDKQLICWNTQTWTEGQRRKGKYEGSIYSLSFSQDGKYLATTNDESVLVIEINPPMTPDPNLVIQDKAPKEPAKPLPRRR